MPHSKNGAPRRSPLTRWAGAQSTRRRCECRRYPMPWRSRRQAALWAAIVMVVVGALVPAESRGADAVLSCPGTAVAGEQFTAEVTIDVAAPCTTNADCGADWTCVNNKCTTKLGAYSVVLDYDPTVVTLTSVSGGHTTEFQGTPTTSTMCPTANSCQTRIASFQTTKACNAGSN